ncbi:MAG: 1,4-alpha-glucan branching protein GlgB [Eubacterium sp.]|nr:1,4-alpha-glucan branching protein GlgB [Eubacterium sp.]
MNTQDFYMGTVFDAYKYFGAHIGEYGVTFRTFAPSAQRVTLIGDFNQWQEAEMTCPERGGFYEITVPEAREGQLYKYVIYGRNGRVEHCDPYGFGMELRPDHASVIRRMDGYFFHDLDWMMSRSRNYDRPLNIFECHLGSFMTNPDDPNGWYRYDQIADKLIDYVKENNFTHVEMMPLAEYPFDGSWGYQQTGYFSPTSRYGTADQLKELVDRLHQAGIGVILDFVPAHFALDYYALKEYDGTPLYEYPNSDVSESEWGSCNFIFSRREVCCFMQSAANYWLAEYHFDGLRMDAISRLIYWMGDQNRGVNGNAVDFLRNMNRRLHELHPTAMLIAEDSTSFTGCTHPADQGGLDFDYKWDLGWMNDTLDYFKKTSAERADRPELLTFSMFYYPNEKHLLPLSHDEVVHGKKTIIDKIYGGYEEKFAQLRSLYMYMAVHPGKKLNFMGNEIAMFREWDETKEPDYFLLDYPIHKAFKYYFDDLNRLLRDVPALYEKDYEPDGFQWICMNDGHRNVYGIERRGREDSIAAFFNFSNEKQTYLYCPESDCDLQALLNTDWEWCGGASKDERPKVQVDAGQGAYIELAPFASVIYSKKNVK